MKHCALYSAINASDQLVTYRPVSNLQYVSKLTEKDVLSLVYDQMVSNAIFPALQSSYRQFHSTDTALIKVVNDVLLKMNSQHVCYIFMIGFECRLWHR